MVWLRTEGFPCTERKRRKEDLGWSQSQLEEGLMPLSLDFVPSGGGMGRKRKANNNSPEAEAIIFIDTEEKMCAEIILGILGAVPCPPFFSLKEKARKRKMCQDQAPNIISLHLPAHYCQPRKYQGEKRTIVLHGQYLAMIRTGNNKAALLWSIPSHQFSYIAIDKLRHNRNHGPYLYLSSISTYTFGSTAENLKYYMLRSGQYTL